MIDISKKLKEEIQWNNKNNVKKGNEGENMVFNYLKNQNYILYHPITSGYHYCDFIAINKRFDKMFLIDVKVRQPRRLYNDVSVTKRNYNIYQKLSKIYNIPFFIFFVINNNIYGNYLNSLMIKNKISNIEYPLFQNKFIYFHTSTLVQNPILNNKK